MCKILKKEENKERLMLQIKAIEKGIKIRIDIAEIRNRRLVLIKQC